jgi:uncharacterized protein (TIGR02117 family)
VRKTFLRILLAIFIVMAAVAAGTFVPRPLLPAAHTSATDSEAVRILVVSNPIHTDIAIPLTADIRATFGFLEGAGVPVSAPDAEWLVFGWGGRSFYLETPTWADLKPMPVVKALTVDRSVLHVDVWGSVDPGHPAISVFPVEGLHAARLVDFILASFVREGGQPVAIPGAGYGRTDAFFESRGAFNILLGCNTWTARALREAGLRTGLWNPLPQTLAVSLALFN